MGERHKDSPEAGRVERLDGQDCFARRMVGDIRTEKGGFVNEMLKIE